MLCEKPYMIDKVPCPCTKCFPCRVNRRRLWAHRIQLESLKSSDSCFVTLTYGEKNLPEGSDLSPKHTQDWLKRLRKILAPEKIRYFLVGEYGDKTQRPHYHAALFGVHPIVAGGYDGQHGVVQKSWNQGYTFVGDLTPDSAMYVAGYCTKKMTSRKDPRLNGRHPEFARMSLRPGLGASAVEDIARSLGTDVGLRDIAQVGDVPHSLTHGRKSLPLGRYLRGKLREKIGYSSAKTPRESLKKYEESLSQLYEDALQDPKIKKAHEKPLSVGDKLMGITRIARLYVDMNKQKINNLKSRTALYEKEKQI